MRPGITSGPQVIPCASSPTKADTWDLWSALTCAIAPRLWGAGVNARPPVTHSKFNCTTDWCGLLFSSEAWIGAKAEDEICLGGFASVPLAAGRTHSRPGSSGADGKLEARARSSLPRHAQMAFVVRDPNVPVLVKSATASSGHGVLGVPGTCPAHPARWEPTGSILANAALSNFRRSSVRGNRPGRLRHTVIRGASWLIPYDPITPFPRGFARWSITRQFLKSVAVCGSRTPPSHGSPEVYRSARGRFLSPPSACRRASSPDLARLP